MRVPLDTSARHSRIGFSVAIYPALLLAAISVVPEANAQGLGATALYDSLRQRAQAGDTAIDYAAMRLAYTAIPNPAPTAALQALMMRHFQTKDYAHALDYAEKILAACYVDIAAHAVCGHAYGQLNNPARSAFHFRMRNALVRSILKTGDGLSPATAFTVISPAEEGAVLAALGLQKKVSEPRAENGHSYSRVTAFDAQSGKDLTIYFNVDIPNARVKGSR